jgi:nicotinamide mononucleotide adenylyltransferase
MKTFKFNDNIRAIEKSILKKLTNYGEAKYEPIQMEKINNLLSYKDNLVSPKNMNNQNPPVSNDKKIRAPKSAGERIKNVNNIPLPQNKNINITNNNVKKNNEIPYPTEKMEKLKERENNKWALQTKKEHEQYIKEQELLKKSVYEKKLKQREILEQQIKEKKEAKEKTKHDEIGQPSLTSLNIGNYDNINTISDILFLKIFRSDIIKSWKF